MFPQLLHWLRYYPFVREFVRETSLLLCRRQITFFDPEAADEASCHPCRVPECRRCRSWLNIASEPALVIFDRKGSRAAALDLTRETEGDQSPLFGEADKIVSKLLAEKSR